MFIAWTFISSECFATATIVKPPAEPIIAASSGMKRASITLCMTLHSRGPVPNPFLPLLWRYAIWGPYLSRTRAFSLRGKPLLLSKMNSSLLVDGFLSIIFPTVFNSQTRRYDGGSPSSVLNLIQHQLLPFPLNREYSSFRHASNVLAKRPSQSTSELC